MEHCKKCPTELIKSVFVKDVSKLTGYFAQCPFIVGPSSNKRKHQAHKPRWFDNTSRRHRCDTGPVI